MPIVLLDSHPLSLISRSANTEESLRCSRRIQDLLKNEISVVVPEIIDYELRRVLIQAKRDKSIEMLNKLGNKGLIYAPITTEVMLKASNLWAWARNTRQSTASQDKIDIDVILAAQSIVISEITGEHTIIATSNIKDLKRYNISVDKWENITVEAFSKTYQAEILHKK